MWAVTAELPLFNCREMQSLRNIRAVLQEGALAVLEVVAGRASSLNHRKIKTVVANCGKQQHFAELGVTTTKPKARVNAASLTRGSARPSEARFAESRSCDCLGNQEARIQVARIAAPQPLPCHVRSAAKPKSKASEFVSGGPSR